MTHRTSHQFRRIAALTVMAMAPLAIMLTAKADLLERKASPVTLEYSLTAAIDESGTTVGIADSDLYLLSKPDGSMDTAAMDRHLDEMLALGVDTVRVVLPWRGNEPARPGTYPPGTEESFWKRSDYIVNAAHSRGMAVVAALAHAPNWASVDPKTDWSLLGFEEPPDPQLFGEYAGRVVDRYGDKIAAYEIWNEPNYLKAWATGIDPAEYTEVLKAAWTAIKGADGPDEDDPLVVAGVLGAVISFGTFTLDPVTFVETMYESGAKGYFDALSFHPYHYTLEFSEGVKNDIWRSPLEQVIGIRQLMLANGDAALRIWATEYGLPTFGANGVTEQHQADFIEDFLNAWKDLEDPDGTSYAGPSFIYTLRDRLRDGVLTQNTSLGIFHADWTAKLAAQIIKNFIEAHQVPDPPDEPAASPDLGAQIAQALQAFFQQIRAAVQGFVTSVNAFVNSVAQAIVNIFNPGGTAAQTLPSELQDEVTEGASLAVASLQVESSDPRSQATHSDTKRTTPAAEEQADDLTAEMAADETNESQDQSEVLATESEEPAEPEATDKATVSEANDDETDRESREPVRTSLVARPGEVGTEDTPDSADDSTADDNAATDATTSAAGTDGSASNSSGDSDSSGDA